MPDTDIYAQCSVCRHWVPKPIESHHSEQDCEINLEAERSALAITTKENSMTDTATTETEIRASEIAVGDTIYDDGTLIEVQSIQTVGDSVILNGESSYDRDTVVVRLTEPAGENGPATPVATPAKVEPELTREQAISKAHNAAISALIEKYRDEFNETKIAEAKALGFEWTPRKSAAEKAKEEIEATLAAHPELREVLRKQLIREASAATTVGDTPPSA